MKSALLVVLSVTLSASLAFSKPKFHAPLAAAPVVEVDSGTPATSFADTETSTLDTQKVDLDKVNPDEVVEQLQKMGIINAQNKGLAKSLIANKLQALKRAQEEGKSDPTEGLLSEGGLMPDNIAETIGSALKDNGIADISAQDLEDIKHLKSSAWGDDPIVGHEDVLRLKSYALRIKKFRLYKKMAELHSQIYLIQKEATSRGYQVSFRWLDEKGQQGQLPAYFGAGAATLWLGSALIRNATAQRPGLIPVTVNGITRWTARIGYLTLAGLVVGYVITAGDFTDWVADFAHTLNTSSPQDLQAFLQTKTDALTTVIDQVNAVEAEAQKNKRAMLESEKARVNAPIKLPNPRKPVEKSPSETDL